MEASMIVSSIAEIEEVKKRLSSIIRDKCSSIINDLTELSKIIAVSPATVKTCLGQITISVLVSGSNRKVYAISRGRIVDIVDAITDVTLICGHRDGVNIINTLKEMRDKALERAKRLYTEVEKAKSEAKKMEEILSSIS